MKKEITYTKVCNSLIIKAVNSWFKFHHRNFIEMSFPFPCFKSAPCAFHFVEIFSKNRWNLKPSNLKTIGAWKSLHRANKYMLKDHNKNTRTRSGISSKLTIKTSERRHWPRSDVFIVNFTYFTRYCRVRVCIVDFEEENVCYGPVL